MNSECSKQDIMAYLAELAAEILDMDAEDYADYNETFLDLGLESVDIPLFIAKVSRRFGVDIEMASIFEHPSIRAYADYLHKKLHKGENDAAEDVSAHRTAECEDFPGKAAVIGVSCRFPGGANSPEEYREVLMNGASGIRDMPGDRWDAGKYYSPDKTEPGKMYTNRGGFLNTEIHQFDAPFFNISPKEAKALDPQQRLLLELTWEAFENAGINISQYFGSNTGVYVGISAEEYSFAHYKSGDLSRIDAYSLTGTTFSTACGRISYTFGFEGPSVSVDTACSSSLTALHMACKALESGETDAVVVGAVTLMLTPAVHVCFSKMEAIAADGQSKSFDASADGFARAEGGGVLLLKRLSDAQRDGDNILGIVRGTAINQDGRSNGLTAPNGAAQEKVIAKALKDAALEYSDVDYVEMHGTGTRLGDPIEIEAVANTYCKGRTREAPLKIGSVKSNIGHLEAAAGMAGIVKVLLAFQNEVIPGNLNFREPNPLIPWESFPLSVVAKNEIWKRGDRPRRAAINGFGFGGSNAHAILEEPPEREPAEAGGASGGEPIYVLKVSAKSRPSLLANAKNLVGHIRRNPRVPIRDIAETNNITRADFNYRLAAYGRTGEELADRLEAFLNKTGEEGIAARDGKGADLQQETRLTFLFSGQGSQYPGMGKELYDGSPVFKEAFDRCDRLFEPYISVSLAEMIYSGRFTGRDIERTDYAQPLIFTIEYALLKFWESLGIMPEAVLGHSIGEYAAAVAAGIMSLEDCAGLVAERGRLMASAPGEGAMSAIYAEEGLVRSLLKDYGQKVSIALHNAQNNIVVSGDRTAVEAVSKEAENRNIKVSRLHVSHAFHSYLMDPILEEFKGKAEEVKFKSSGIRYISAALARPLDKGEIPDAAYWTDHIRTKVDFYHAFSGVKNTPNTIFLEIGPGNTLCALGELILRGEGTLLSSLDRRKNPWEQIVRCIGRLYCHGTTIAWDKLDTGFGREYNRVILPAYAFDRKPYWMQPEFSRETGSPAGHRAEYHPLLGQRLSTPYLKNSTLYQSVYTAQHPYFMQEHVLFDRAVAPAAAHVSMLLAIAGDLRHPSGCTIENMEFHAPLTAAQDEERTVQFLIEDSHSDRMRFELVSSEKKTENANWIQHCRGNLQVSHRMEEEKRISVEELKNRYPEVTSGFTVYDVMKKFGFKLGDGFKGIVRVWRGEGEGVCHIEPKKDIPGIPDDVVYAGIIDSIFQTVFSVSELSRKMDSQSDKYSLKTTVPISIGRLKYCYRDAESYWCHVRADNSQQSGVAGDIEVYNEKGETVFKIEKIMARLTDRDSLLREVDKTGDRLLYSVKWMEKAGNAMDIKADSNEKIVLFGNDAPVVNRFRESFGSYGIDTVKVMQGDGYTELQDDEYVVSCTNKGDFEKLLRRITSRHGNKKYRLVYLSTCDEAAMNQVNSEELRTRAEKDCSGLLYLVQAITELNHIPQMTLKVVTNNVHPLGGAAISIYQSTLWGFSEVIRLEHPPVWEGILDTDVTMLQSNVDEIIREIKNGADGQVVLRDRKRYTPRLAKGAENPGGSDAPAISVRGDAAYMIAGGTGTIGQAYAEYLIEKGAKNIVLLSRSGAEGELLEKVNAWEAGGIHVRLEKADISIEADVTAAVQKLKQDGISVKGLVHAAGTLEDRMIKDQTWRSFERLFETKLRGTYNLHNALKDEDLDFFIMNSSITSVVGNVGQANYAAANYFTDIFAQYRRSLGMPAMSICWGPWAGTGMSVKNEAAIRNIELKGIRSMSGELGKKMMDRVFHKDFPSVVIADANWELFGERTGVEEVTEFLGDFITKEKASEESGKKEGDKEEILAKLKALEPGDRSGYLLSRLLEITAKTMGSSSADSVSPDSTFMEQGVDSLMIFSLRNQIAALIDVQVDISVFFNHPSPRKLSEYLSANMAESEEKENEKSVG
jgi:acyl transferase domain-containing protein/NAD(P)-dependent dehydrogenase (short-subunit alcohol dehydrogenase family)/acyl carrier protein